MEQIAASVEISGVPANPENPSIWASAKETLVPHDAFNGPRRTEVRLPDVPRAYMRVVPAGWKSHRPSIADITSLPESLKIEAPHDSSSSGDYGATEEGFVRYWLTGEYGAPPSTTNVSMFFADTGEFWLLHGTVIVPHKDYSLLRDQAMLAQWSKLLRRSMMVFDRFGAHGARRVEAGMCNVSDLRWYAEWEGDRPLARRSNILTERQGRDWGRDAQLTYLTNSYNEVRNLFSLPRFSEAQVLDLLKQIDPERLRGYEED